MLDSLRLSTGSHWYVIRTHHWQESRAQANLSMGGIETFLPWVRVASHRSPGDTIARRSSRRTCSHGLILPSRFMT